MSPEEERAAYHAEIAAIRLQLAALIARADAIGLSVEAARHLQVSLRQAVLIVFDDLDRVDRLIDGKAEE